MSVAPNRVFRDRFSETKVKENSAIEDMFASYLWTERGLEAFSAVWKADTPWDKPTTIPSLYRVLLVGCAGPQSS